MVRVVVTSWLILTILLGPWLCCCSIRTSALCHVVQSTTPSTEEGCPACCAHKQTTSQREAPSPDAPTPCPCKQVSQLEAILADTSSSEQDLIRFLAVDLFKFVLPMACISNDSLVEARSLEPPVSPLLWVRLALLQTLRC